MVDDRRREARPVRGNVTTEGRYGTAAEEELHMEPEVAPMGSEEGEARVPEALPGALPENQARRARDDEEREG